MVDDRSSIISWLTKLLAIGVGVFIIYQLRYIAILAFLGLILASAIRPAVRFGRKLYLPAVISIMLSYIFIFTSLSVLLSFVIPPLAQESASLLQSASEQLGLDNRNFVQEITLDVSELGQVAKNFDQYNGFLTQLTGSVQVVLGLLVSTFSLLVVIFSLLVIAFHMLSNIESFSISFAWLLPRKTREERAKLSLEIMDTVTLQLGAWVRGQILLMFVIGTGTYLGLIALGVPYALPLAILAGLMEFIPNLGPTLSAIPAIAVAFLLVNPVVGFLTLAFYVIVQQLENSLIVPGIMKNAVDVQPLTTILLLLVGFEIMGITGAVISVPLYVVARTVVRIIWPDRGPFADYAQYLPPKLQKRVREQISESQPIVKAK